MLLRLRKLPGAEPILGATALYAMGIEVDPVNQTGFAQKVLNSAHGSGRIVQVLPIYRGLLINRSGLKYPPTPVGGIRIRS